MIASASSVAAFLVVPLFWKSGTLFATAMTPVIVAIVRELLVRPVEKVGAVGSKLGAVAPLRVPERDSGDEAARFGRRRAPEPARAARASHAPPPATGPRGADPFGLNAAERRQDLGRRALRLGLITGLLAFAAVAVFMTASELAVLGKSFGGEDKPTLVSGGGSSKDEEDEPAPEPTQTAPDATPEGEATPAPDATETPAEDATPTPAPSPAPDGTPIPAPTPTAPATPPGQPAPTPAPVP